MADPFNAITRFLLDGALRLDSGRTEDPHWQPGARVSAQVRAIVDPTRVVLQIGEHVVDAKIPIPVTVGQRLALRVVEPFPKLVFTLDNPEQPAQTQVSLSQAGRVIGEVIRTMPAAQAGNPLRLTNVPALPKPNLPKAFTDEIARSLKQAVDKSGLFYEKHQARWIAGDYPLTDLKQEPQTTFSRPAGPAAPNPPAAQLAVAGDEGETEAPVANRALPEDKLGTLRGSVESRGAPEPPLRAQLELVDGRPVTIALPGWEQREVYWDLPQREADAQAAPDEEVWSTQLRLSFPHLGSITANLRLSGNSVALSVAAGSSSTHARLVTQQEVLIAAFRSAGLTLSQLGVTEEE